MAADEVAGAEGSEAKSQPDELPPPHEWSQRPNAPRADLTVPATSARFRAAAGAGSEHRKVSKPAYPK